MQLGGKKCIMNETRQPPPTPKFKLPYVNKPCKCGKKHLPSACKNKVPVNRKKNLRQIPCLLTCIKPNNVEEEKEKFMNAENYDYNPQFEYDYQLNPVVIERFNKASSLYLPQAVAIMECVIEKYGSYKRFEHATAGKTLSKTQLWSIISNYLRKEGFYGDIVVDISKKLVSRGAMVINAGRPTLCIRENAAKRIWVEGLLCHEIGTHHIRFHNNRQQIWSSTKVRRSLQMKGANPTEEGLASLHSVILRKDPHLWRTAILYYTAYKASQLSFSELFHDLGRFVKDPECRWDYCLRTKRGQSDTSLPGCFGKDQVYLSGVIPLLLHRHTLDFQLLTQMGKVSYEDIEMLRPHYRSEKTKIPTFMQDIDQYRNLLDRIVQTNNLEPWLQKLREQSSTPTLPPLVKEKPKCEVL